MNRLFTLICLLLGISFNALPQYRIIPIGDSTVQDYNDGYAPRKGWGQMLTFFFDKSKVTVLNKAVGGTSSKSFYENHWPAVRSQLKEGDFVFIQFGINDRNSSDANRYAPGDVFKSYIKKFVDDTRAKKAIPVLVSTVRRCAWTNGKPYDSYHEHPQLMRDMAKTLNTPLIDLDQFCYDLFVEQGELYATRFLTMNLQAGEYVNYPKGNTDQVHYQEIGATENARFVTESIEKSTDANLKRLAQCTLPRHKVTFTINDKSKSKAFTRSGYYPEGINVTLKTINQDNAKFLRWEDGNKNVISTKTLFTLKMSNKDITYKAVYESDIPEEITSVPDIFEEGDTKIAYITDPSVANYNIDNILPMLKKKKGFYVEEMNAQNSQIDLSDFDVVVISEVTPSTAPLMTQLQQMEKPTLSMKVHAYKNATGAWKWATTGFGDNTQQTAIAIPEEKRSHPIFQGINLSDNGKLELLKRVNEKGLTFMNAANFTNLEGNVVEIASIAGQAQTCILEMKAGIIVNGTTLQSKMLQIGLNSSSYSNLTSDAEKLIVNSIFYLLTPEEEGEGTVTQDMFDNSPTIVVTNHNELIITGRFMRTTPCVILHPSGITVRQFFIQANCDNQTFDLSTLSHGVYLIKCKNHYTKILLKH